MARRRDAFPPDRGLQVRIAVAVVVQAVLVAVMVATLVLVVATLEIGWGIAFFFLCFLGIGLAAGQNLAHARRKDVRAPTPEDEGRVHAAVQRLAVQANASSPKIAVERDRIALSWTTALPWGTPTIHVTTELLDLLPDDALEAVVAHELAHVVNHDATVMTLLAAPGTWLLRGVRQMWAEGATWPLGTRSISSPFARPEASAGCGRRTRRSAGGSLTSNGWRRVCRRKACEVDVNALTTSARPRLTVP